MVYTLSNPDSISPIPALTQNRDEISGRLMDDMTALLNEIAAIQIQKDEPVNFETLSLIRKDGLEVIYSKTVARRSRSPSTNENKFPTP